MHFIEILIFLHNGDPSAPIINFIEIFYVTSSCIVVIPAPHNESNCFVKMFSENS